MKVFFSDTTLLTSSAARNSVIAIKAAENAVTFRFKRDSTFIEVDAKIADASEEVDCCVNGGEFSAAISGRDEFKLSSRGNFLQIESNYGRVEIPVLHELTFDDLAYYTGELLWTFKLIPKSQFHAFLPFTADDQLRPQLFGVNVFHHDGYLWFAATDGRQLAFCRYPETSEVISLSGNYQEKSILIPGYLKALLSFPSYMVKVHEKGVLYSSTDHRIFVPNFEFALLGEKAAQIAEHLSDDSFTECECSVNELLNALRYAQALMQTLPKTDIHEARVSWNNNEIKIYRRATFTLDLAISANTISVFDGGNYSVDLFVEGVALFSSKDATTLRLRRGEKRGALILTSELGNDISYFLMPVIDAAPKQKQPEEDEVATDDPEF